MARLWPVGMVLALLAGAPADAQVRQQPRGEQGREVLRQQVRDRFMENYRQHAALTEDQYQRFRAVAERHWEERTGLDVRERQIWRGLEAQVRPGRAADADSVTRLLEGLLEIEERRAALRREEHREYGAFLNPVQRAQYMLATTRFERQIEALIRQRMEQGRPRMRRQPR